MTTATDSRPLAERALEVLRRAGNPFRNYFARNPDDESCARYHVPELYAEQRAQLLAIVDLYRLAPGTHSEVIPILGNKGAGKTHLLHSIKHGGEGGWQLLVTPGVYQKDSEFLEYLLFQLIDTLLGGGRQKNVRPLDFVAELAVRALLADALSALPPAQRLELFPPAGLRWATLFGFGSSHAQERVTALIDALRRPAPGSLRLGGARKVCEDAGLPAARALEIIGQHVERTEAHNTAGLMRRHILAGLARASFLGDEADLATFLTYGFAELDFKVRPSRQDLVLALFKALMGLTQSLHVPTVFAFDQLEDLLLSRRSDDAHKIAEAFFAGIVQAMHQLDGIAFLIFAERGLWNRFVPSLDGYIQDRLNNPIHLPGHGTVQSLKLEAPPPELVLRVAEARLQPALSQLPEWGELPATFPLAAEQVERVATTEATLRDMLQQLRQMFDAAVYRAAEPPAPAPAAPINRLPADQQLPEGVKSFVVVDAAASSGKALSLSDLWDQEVRAAKRKLEPDGALTGATRELQAGLGAFLRIAFEQGVKVGPWRIQHVVPEWAFGEHPTYGVLTIAHWVCKGGQPWKVGVGLFLGRSAAKPRDLAVKLSALEVEPAVLDHLILLRPEDDLGLTGKSKTLWQEAERRGRHARLEPVSLEAFAALYAFPRIVSSLTESLPDGQPMPSLAGLVREKCEKLLEQVCLPVQG
jgi:hypothetical protein